MKKLMSCGLVLATTLTLGAATQAHADIVDNGDGSQTINNNIGDKVTDADIKVEGYLGFDNTDPNQPDPEDPNEWINVTLPTAVIFNTDSKDSHKSIKSGNYTVKNHSGRPVAVDVKSFSDGTWTKNGSISDIASLNLASKGETQNKKVNLVDSSGVVSSFGELMKLDSSATSLFDGTELNFVFEGETSEAWNPGKGVEKLDTSMELHFKPLQADGSEFA